MLHLNNKPFPAIQKFIQENPVLVYWYMVLSIDRAIKIKNDKAELFSFGGAGENIAIIKTDDYEKILTEAIEQFVKVEEYEYAEQAKRILQSWKIEQLINEKNME